MPYASEQVSFDYDNLSNPSFLSNLKYVRQTNNGRLIYQVRFPNSPIDYEDSLILSLKDGGLIIYKRRDFLEGNTLVGGQVEVSDVTWLVEKFPFMGSYDKFVASCFLSSALYFI